MIMIVRLAVVAMEALTVMILAAAVPAVVVVVIAVAAREESIELEYPLLQRQEQWGKGLEVSHQITTGIWYGDNIYCQMQQKNSKGVICIIHSISSVVVPINMGIIIEPRMREDH